MKKLIRVQVWERGGYDESDILIRRFAFLEDELDVFTIEMTKLGYEVIVEEPIDLNWKLWLEEKKKEELEAVKRAEEYRKAHPPTEAEKGIMRYYDKEINDRITATVKLTDMFKSIGKTVASGSKETVKFRRYSEDGK